MQIQKKSPRSKSAEDLRIREETHEDSPKKSDEYTLNTQLLKRAYNVDRLSDSFNRSRSNSKKSDVSPAVRQKNESPPVERLVNDSPFGPLKTDSDELRLQSKSRAYLKDGMLNIGNNKEETKKYID